MVHGYEARDSVREATVVALHDTLREVTRITVQLNHEGDTVKVIEVTDRERARKNDRYWGHDERVSVRRDTVYVERRDSSFVKTTNRTDDTNQRGSSFQGTLKWIFAIIMGLIGLTITVKVCLRK